MKLKYIYWDIKAGFKLINIAIFCYLNLLKEDKNSTTNFHSSFFNCLSFYQKDTSTTTPWWYLSEYLEIYPEDNLSDFLSI